MSAPFRARHKPVSGRLCATPPRRGAVCWSRFPVAFRPPAFASRSSLPARGLCPSYDRPTGTRGCRTLTGFPASARMSCDLVGRPLYPGTGGALTDHPMSWSAACRPSTARVLASGVAVHLSGVNVHEASTRVHAIRPPGLPLTCRPRVIRGASGFSLGFAPARTGPVNARQDGDRLSSTSLELHDRHHSCRPSDL